MRIPLITRLAPLTSPFSFLNNQRYDTTNSDLKSNHVPIWRSDSGLQASLGSHSADATTKKTSSSVQDTILMNGRTYENVARESLPTRQPQPSSPKAPKIPPPDFFDDPVDLSVVVSWVEDVFSEKWGTLEDIQPLFYEFGVGYTQVAICISNAQKNIYVTFRGTDIFELADVTANINILWDSYGPFDKTSDPEIDVAGRVQRGWNRKVFNPRLYKPLSEELKLVKRVYPDYNVIVAGHSLGAALSILYGTYVAKYVFPEEPVQVINLGSPRVGDETFHHSLRQIPNLTIWRLVFGEDIVPRYPPMLMGYRHVGHLLHWDKDGKVKAYHEQLESCTGVKQHDQAPPCYAGIDPKDWNILLGRVDHHAHKHYKCIVEQSKKVPEKYWPEGFEVAKKGRSSQREREG